MKIYAVICKYLHGVHKCICSIACFVDGGWQSHVKSIHFPFALLLLTYVLMVSYFGWRIWERNPPSNNITVTRNIYYRIFAFLQRKIMSVEKKRIVYACNIRSHYTCLSFPCQPLPTATLPQLTSPMQSSPSWFPFNRITILTTLALLYIFHYNL